MSGVCHMPHCRRPLATMTLCKCHAARLLGRLVRLELGRSTHGVATRHVLKAGGRW